MSSKEVRNIIVSYLREKINELYPEGDDFTSEQYTEYLRVSKASEIILAQLEKDVVAEAPSPSDEGELFLVRYTFDVYVKAKDKNTAEIHALDLLDPELIWVSDSEASVEKTSKGKGIYG